MVMVCHEKVFPELERVGIEPCKFPLGIHPRDGIHFPFGNVSECELNEHTISLGDRRNCAHGKQL
jgi:hypothetical protein